MKLKFNVFAAFAAIAVSLPAQPVIVTEKDGGGVVNAASRIGSALPGGGVAQGSLFSVRGKNLGDCGENTSAFPLGTSFNGTSIKIAASDGSSYDALIQSVAACRDDGKTLDEVIAVLPSATPAGDAKITLSYNGTTDEYPITVVPYAFGIFSRDKSGAGSGSIVDAATQNVITVSAPAMPGQTVTMTGTGLGAVSFDETNPAPASEDVLAPDLEVWVGTSQAQVMTNRRQADCCTAVDQVTFVVPDNASGCAVPVFTRRGTVVSNFVSMAVSADGSTCSEPVAGLSKDDLAALLGNEKLSYGNIQLSRSSIKATIPGAGTIDQTSDSGSASFFRYDLTTMPAGSFSFVTTSLKGCTVWRYSGGVGQVLSTVRPTGLDAGSAIKVSAAGGSKDLLPVKDTPGSYSAQLGNAMSIPGFPGGIPGLGGDPLFLNKGDFQISGPGGADIGNFSQTLTLPDMLNWTNGSKITDIDRTTNLEVTWTGGDPNGTVTISGMSMATETAAAAFYCTAPASAESFTVPAAVLEALPPSYKTKDNIPTGSLSLSNSGTPVRFSASGCDLCSLNYSSGASNAVNYK